MKSSLVLCVIQLCLSLKLKLIEAVYVSVNLDQCSTNAYSPFTLDYVGIDCSSGCSWGSQARIYGNFTINDSSLNIYPNVTVSAWGQNAFSSQVNICNGIKSTDSSNAYWYKTNCPTEGTYEFSRYATLPNPSQWRFSASMLVTVSSIFDFGDEVVVCTFNVVTTTYGNGNGYRNSWNSDSNSGYNAYFITSGAVILFGAVAHGIRRRRRRIATVDDCNDIHEAVMSRVSFERMGKEENTRSLPQPFA